MALGLRQRETPRGVGPTAGSIMSCWSKDSTEASRLLRWWKGILRRVWWTGLTFPSICSLTSTFFIFLRQVNRLGYLWNTFFSTDTAFAIWSILNSVAVVYPRREVSLSTTRNSASTALHFESMTAAYHGKRGRWIEGIDPCSTGLQIDTTNFNCIGTNNVHTPPESTKNLHTTPFTFKETKGALTLEAGTSNLNVYSSSELDKHEETQVACTVSIPESSIQFLIILL